MLTCAITLLPHAIARVILQVSIAFDRDRVIGI